MLLCSQFFSPAGPWKFELLSTFNLILEHFGFSNYIDLDVLDFDCLQNFAIDLVLIFKAVNFFWKKVSLLCRYAFVDLCTLDDSIASSIDINDVIDRMGQLGRICGTFVVRNFPTGSASSSIKSKLSGSKSFLSSSIRYGINGKMAGWKKHPSSLSTKASSGSCDIFSGAVLETNNEKKNLDIYFDRLLWIWRNKLLLELRYCCTVAERCI